MTKKNPNILLVVIDSLRSDRITSQEYAKIPNIRKLIKEGTMFSQVISTSDVTGTCLGSLFSGVYPFETGITQTNIETSKMGFFKNLKKNNYKLFATIPKYTWFEKIIKDFDDYFMFDHTKWKEEETILGQLGNKALEFFKKNTKTEPWFHYLHLVDIHGTGSLVKVPEQFNSEEWGKSKYDQLLSATDSWLKLIFEQISLEDTLVIITSDHGEYVESDFDLRDMPNFYKAMRKLKKKFPQLTFLGEKFFLFVLNTNEKIKTRNIDIEKEKKFIPRGYTKYLFDDVIKIPLIITGLNTPNQMEIKNLVRQIDIYPTIARLANIEIDEKIHGRDIFSSIENNENEIPAYIEVGSIKPKTPGKTIGIRTSSYKYFRNRIEKNKDVFLFDLEKDPKEQNNISLDQPKIISKYEEILEKILKNSKDFSGEKISDEEKMIEEELRKMGYL
ncbi:MAG: sulfatase-like hydrolase/transferase [Nitrosopumilus sp.]|nr:sulfatase-like hydrolase/transferase [Nitrosopumilus sp.]